MTFDHGPLGMPPLFNHGHADALSITLSFNGKPLLVDPGTFQYNGDPDVRRYFKGTRAHNTITVDGKDQAVQETGFVWSRPYRARLERNSAIGDGRLLEAVHDGYRRLDKPVTHRRKVLIAENYLAIRDQFEGAGIHDFDLHYHLHPATRAEREGNGWKISREEIQLIVRLLFEDTFQLVRGRKEPILGWHSSSYNALGESGVLICSKRGRAQDVCFTTVMGRGKRVNDRDEEKIQLLIV